MNGFLRLLAKYHVSIVFVLIETLCLLMVVRQTDDRGSRISRFTVLTSGTVATTIDNVRNYFRLRTDNQQLAAENAQLKEALTAYRMRTVTLDSLVDYRFTCARVVDGTFHLNKNRFVVNKGSADGVHPDMAILSPDGVVGIIDRVDEHHATVIPLINTELRLSAVAGRSSALGSLVWDGKALEYSSLNDMPFHADVTRGDTVFTSGYSAIFPYGEPIGVVEEVSRKNTNFLRIKVRLMVDFRRVHEVYLTDFTPLNEALQ